MPKKIPDDPVDQTADETPAPRRRVAKPQEEKETAAKPAAKKPAAKKPTAKVAVKQTAVKESTVKGKPAKAPAAQKEAAQPPAPTKARVTAERPAPEPAAARDASAPPATAAQAADNPLHKKLGLRPGVAGVLVAPPEDSDNPLLPLPDGFVTVAGIDALAPLAGPFDYMQVFARDRAELASAFGLLRDKLAPNGSLWVSWMKQAGRGMTGDLNENVIRRLALTHGMVDVKIAALDRDWAALRLIHRKH